MIAAERLATDQQPVRTIRQYRFRRDELALHTSGQGAMQQSFKVYPNARVHSDIIHQSVYELVHSEDREELQKQLLWNSFLPADLSGIQLSEALVPEKDKLLERSFTVRFRCLLDNTSGFLRLDIRGRVKILHGQNKKNEEPPLALFAFCTPFGPPSLLEIPPKENMFKSKHKLDFSLVSMDHKYKSANERWRFGEISK
uniref:Uncharacterized protein n=1 Tax=Anopheles maculatus TaxID=74869 RepID=A0A182TCG4_9DIPT